MIAYALKHRAQHFGLAGVELYVEKHACRLGILEGAAVAVNADLVEHKVLLDPLEAFAGGLHLGEIIIFPLLRADDAGDHGNDVDLLLVDDRADPAGGAGINVRLADLGAACSHADERCVTAAAVNGRSGLKAEVGCRFFAQRACHVGTLDKLRQMGKLNAVHIAQRPAPAALAGAAVVQERRIRRIARHDESARAAADEIFLNVEPFVHLFKDLRLVFLHPFILPQGILHAR